MTITSVHVHLLLNHLPIIGTIAGVLLRFASMIRCSDELRRVSLAMFVIVAGLTIPVYLTGEGAERAVSGLPAVTEALIEAHQDAALVSFIASGVLGVVALAGSWRYQRSAAPPRTLMNVVLLWAVVVSGLMVWTGGLGGQIRHSGDPTGEYSDAGKRQLRVAGMNGMARDTKEPRQPCR